MSLFLALATITLLSFIGFGIGTIIRIPVQLIKHKKVFDKTTKIMLIGVLVSGLLFIIEAIFQPEDEVETETNENTTQQEVVDNDTTVDKETKVKEEISNYLNNLLDDDQKYKVIIEGDNSEKIFVDIKITDITPDEMLEQGMQIYNHIADEYTFDKIVVKYKEDIDDVFTIKIIIADGEVTQNDYEEQVTKEESNDNTSTEQQVKEDYDTGITYDNLARTPDDYTGEKCKFSGKVIQIMEEDGYYGIRLAVDGNYDNVIFVLAKTDVTSVRILDDDYITVYGTSAGIYTYETVMGNSLSIPSMIVNKIDM